MSKHYSSVKLFIWIHLVTNELFLAYFSAFIFFRLKKHLTIIQLTNIQIHFKIKWTVLDIESLKMFKYWLTDYVAKKIGLVFVTLRLIFKPDFMIFLITRVFESNHSSYPFLHYVYFSRIYFFLNNGIDILISHFSFWNDYCFLKLSSQWCQKHNISLLRNLLKLQVLVSLIISLIISIIYNLGDINKTVSILKLYFLTFYHLFWYIYHTLLIWGLF